MTINGAPCTISWEPIEQPEPDPDAVATSDWIAARNAATGDEMESKKLGKGPWWNPEQPLGIVAGGAEFIPPTQDQKAMMDPFYQLYVAGVSDRSTEAPRFTDEKVSTVIESPRYRQRYIEVNGQIEIDRDSHEMGQ